MSMLKTIGYVFIGIGMAGVAISAVNKIVKLNQEKKTKTAEPEVNAVATSEMVEKVAIERPRPAKIHHYNELLQRVAIHDDRLARSAKKHLSTVRKRTKVIVHR